MARISEVHYANHHAKTTGVAEFVEVALRPGEDPARFTIGLYSARGAQGLAVRLDDSRVEVTYDAASDEFVHLVSSRDFRFLLTDPDGGGTNYPAVALADTGPGGGVVAFLDWGSGTQNILARDGVAAGATSEHVPTDTAPPGDWDYALQFAADDPTRPVFAATTPGRARGIRFRSGTRILTPTGARPIETLRPGDPVLTRDRGPRPVRWIGRMAVRADGNMAPVRIAAGVLGATRPLFVSPQHRLLVCGPAVQRATGAHEALVAATHLVDGLRVTRRPMPVCAYLHLLLDRHEVLTAEGVAAESLLLARHGIAALHAEMRASVEAACPGRLAQGRRTPRPARPLLAGRDARAQRDALLG